MSTCKVLVAVLAAVLSALAVVGPAAAGSSATPTNPLAAKASSAGVPKCC